MSEDFTFEEWLYFNQFSGDDLAEQIDRLRRYFYEHPQEFWALLRSVWS